MSNSRLFQVCICFFITLSTPSYSAKYKAGVYNVDMSVEALYSNATKQFTIAELYSLKKSDESLLPSGMFHTKFVNDNPPVITWCTQFVVERLDNHLKLNKKGSHYKYIKNQKKRVETYLEDKRIEHSNWSLKATNDHIYKIDFFRGNIIEDWEYESLTAYIKNNNEILYIELRKSLVKPHKHTADISNAFFEAYGPPLVRKKPFLPDQFTYVFIDTGNDSFSGKYPVYVDPFSRSRPRKNEDVLNWDKWIQKYFVSEKYHHPLSSPPKVKQKQTFDESMFVSSGRGKSFHYILRNDAALKQLSHEAAPKCTALADGYIEEIKSHKDKKFEL